MKVLQVCYKYPPFFSGYGKQLHAVNKEIVKSDGINITVLTAYGYKINNTLYPNLTVKSLFKTNRERGNLFYYFFCFFSPMVYFFEFFKADIVHIVKAGPEVIVPFFISKLLGKKVIVKVAQDDLEALLPCQVSFLKRIRRYSLCRVDILVALSHKIAAEALAIGVPEDRVKAIPNGVDFNLYSFSKQEEIKGGGIKSYIFLGAISKRKGVDYLLEALAKYRGETIKFTFAGPYYDVGSFEKKLQSIAGAGFVQIAYLGAIDQAGKILRNYDCLVLPSYNEGLPNVVLEAAACGLHLILSDIPIHKELSEKISISIFKLECVEDLLDKINIFNSRVENAAERKSQSEAAELNYSLVNIAARYKEVYGMLV